MKKEHNSRLTLAITLILFVFKILIVSLLISGAIWLLLQHIDFIPLSNEQSGNGGENAVLRLIFIFLICIITGTALTGFFSKSALNPIRKVIDAIKKVADGNFSVSLNIKGIGELEELSESFNKMTQELSSIQTFRSDFINNFSHEFKTPIVSIRGFAKLLKEGDLTEEERQEYLDIIISESERLADLSTNVLNLSKYESIEIVSDVKPFRIDEQIRRTLVLLESKWEKKDLDMNVELEEIVYNGNAELLQLIWINLLDNAIKFTKNNGNIQIRLSKWNGGIRFQVQDDGTGMDQQTQAHIFDKFYQADNSHKTNGNGLGLTLVKRIVELCKGRIEVQSEIGNGSVFTVWLPV